MKADIREISAAPTRAAAKEASTIFVENHGAKYPEAAECLTRDRDALPAFFDFPAEHWEHPRSTNTSVLRPRLSMKPSSPWCGTGISAPRAAYHPPRPS